MIRFCDREICCVAKQDLNRQALLQYFLDGHRQEPLCVLNEAGKFEGIITYRSLLGHELWDAVRRDYVILNERIWEEGRRCFQTYQMETESEVWMLPVLDARKNLICFAYQDREADRELRMLDELMQKKTALGFCDLYPEYDHVTVHGCNELAYYFVRYLKEMGVSVTAEGDLWKNFLIKNIAEEMETLDYRCFAVYGEGTEPKDSSVGLRCSVSAEFECIDRIYEANILEGTIRDTEGNRDDFLHILSGKPVGILGTGVDSLNAYDTLLSYGIDICCFVADRENGCIFGKRVMSRAASEAEWNDIIYIQADARYSAWGFGETDRYHYLGYKRNQRFFLLQDYTELFDRGLYYVLMHIIEQMAGRLVLTGDLWMCLALEQALKPQMKSCKKIVYCDMLQKYTDEKTELDCIQGEEIQQEDRCILLLPKYYGCKTDDGKSSYRREVLEQYIAKAEQYRISHLTEYPFENTDILKEKQMEVDQEENCLKPGRLMIGSINYLSGNIFFEGILDNHPDILKIQCSDSYLSSNLLSVCVRLATRKSSEILPLFWKIYEEESRKYYRKDIAEILSGKRIFDETVSEWLSGKERFSSQELFVILHIAYGKMMGKEIGDLSKAVIYWEPHSVPRSQCEQYAVWLNGAGDSEYMINVVRNAYIRAGSHLHNYYESNLVNPMLMIKAALDYPNEEKKDHMGWKRIVMRFEDLKRNPQTELQSFCDQTKIAWSDTFLEVQTSYNGIAGFDLKPVYRTWEEYLSEFDRFRISLIAGAWQKEYGYPYVKSGDFSRKELKEMFQKKFRFEKSWDFSNRETEMFFLRKRQKLICDMLWRARRKEILGESADGVSCFAEYR